MEVAVRKDETMSCVECGGWNARWVSTFAGHVGVSHDGDLSQYCRDCKKVFDVMLNDIGVGVHDMVRMAPEDVGWAGRKIWYHAGSADWWSECPGDVRVHVGVRETSEWLGRLEDRSVLYTVRVVGEMPKRLVKDVGDGWGRYSRAYVNSWESPGRVSLYLPKSRLELVEKEEL